MNKFFRFASYTLVTIATYSSSSLNAQPIVEPGSLADHSWNGQGSYRFECQLTDLTTSCSQEQELGYCVTKVTLNKYAAEVSIFSPTKEIYLLPLVLENVSEYGSELKLSKIYASDEMGFSGGAFYVGENVVSIELGEVASSYHNGLLTLEEDFSFNLTCVDMSFVLE